MSAARAIRRARAKQQARDASRTPARDCPVVVVPGACVPTGPVPVCRRHREPCVYTACACHPSQGGWQCAREPLEGHMQRVR